MNMLTLLLEDELQPTLMLRIPPAKQLALRGIPSTATTGLQKNTEISNLYKHKIIQTRLRAVTYLKAW